MSAPNSNDLPEDVQAQVDKIRDEEGLNEEVTPPEPDVEHEIKLTRRARERQEERAAVEAAREAATKAQEALEHERRAREEDRARIERMERSMNEMAAFARGAVGTQPQPGPQQGGEDWREEYSKQRKKAQKALEAGDMNEYHERLEKATMLKLKAEIAPTIPNPRQFQQFQPAPQAPQKPAWVQVVENEFPDVVTHDRGFDTVATFVRLAGTAPQNLNADALRKAFNRAREELGTKQRNDAQREQKRQLLAGGGSTGRVAGGTGTKGPSVNVKLPPGFDPRVIAKRAGMTVQEYAKAYGKMNPGDVNQGE